MTNDRILLGERVLKRQDGGADVVVRIYVPMKDEYGAFICQYQICGIGSEAVRIGGGIDGIQAVQVALLKIGADLHLRHRGIRLTFGDLSDSGFPEPSPG
jgi:hypothetical protein